MKIIETPGGTKNNDEGGPQEVDFSSSKLWGASSQIQEIVWLKPKFPKEIIEGERVWNLKRKLKDDFAEDLDKGRSFWSKLWGFFIPLKLSEEQARKLAIVFAREQIGEPYSIHTSKWEDHKWYCSKLVFKSYSSVVKGMYLEDYHREKDPKSPNDCCAGPKVTPEDLVDGSRTFIFHQWKKS